MIIFVRTTYHHQINCCDESYSAPHPSTHTYMHTGASAAVFDLAPRALLCVLGAQTHNLGQDERPVLCPQ